MRTQRTGKYAEELAENFLLQQGLTTVTRNFSCRYGEIDLVMQDADTIVFVEVRYRSSDDYGGALESVNHTKQARLRRTALFYLQQHELLENIARIDVIAVSPAADHSGNQEPDITWVQNAVEG